MLAKIEKSTSHCRPITCSSYVEYEMYIINVLLAQIHVMNKNILFWHNIHLMSNLKNNIFVNRIL